MKKHEQRTVAIIREIAVTSITEEEISAWAYRNIMRRLSDKEHDYKCKTRFQGLTKDEIREEIRGDILLGKEP